MPFRDPWSDDDQPWIDTMQVCEAGHKITGRAKKNPENLVKNCPKCGSKTIMNCPTCNASIPGYKHYPRVYGADLTTPPEFCSQCGGKFPWTGKQDAKASTAKPAPGFEQVFQILKTFHLVCRQLRVRHDNRATLDVSDEYDVQDLLHALLHTHFDDIRPEEWTPSYAGKSSRVDFLLKHAGIVIEVKKTRQGLATKEVGEQLISDAARYKQQPDCRHLICFIYDPDGRIVNAKGLISDIERLSSDSMKVTVIITP